MLQAAVEALYAIYNRPHFSDDDIRNLVLPMYDRSTVEVLKRLYAFSIVDANDIDPDKYLLSKKFSEVKCKSPSETDLTLTGCSWYITLVDSWKRSQACFWNMLI